MPLFTVDTLEAVIAKNEQFDTWKIFSRLPNSNCVCERFFESKTSIKWWMAWPKVCYYQSNHKISYCFVRPTPPTIQFLTDRVDHTWFCTSSHITLQLICDDRQRIRLLLYFHCLCVCLELTCITRIVTERKSDLVSAWISNKMRAFYSWIAAWQSQLIVSLWQIFPPYSRIIL